MSQRTLAGLIAIPLAAVLILFAFFKPLPYVVYRPGLTVDVLGQNGTEPIIEVAGKNESDYPDTGQLRMVTVSVTSPDTKLHLPELIGAWLDKKAAVYPWSSVYTKGESNDDSKAEGAAQMASSQDVATAIALKETGVDVPQVTTIAGVQKGEPADGVLQAGDIVLAIDGHDASDADAMVKLIQATPAGDAITMRIKRAGTPQTVTLTPTDHDGVPRIGASVGVGYDLPVKVKVNIDPAIGGPSAGLIFSLAIYDTLTPGSLTGGNRIAGTGEIEPDGSVGAIGGIQQKIAGATRDGAKLFLVPTENCDEAVGAVDAQEHHIRLVKVTTMHDARTSIDSWVANHDATLPTCKAASDHVS